MSVKKIIKSLEFFSTLSEKQVEAVALISTVQNYSEEYILHYENKEGSKLLFLSEGLAKAYKIDKYGNEVFLYYIHKNALISEVTDMHSDTLYSFSNIELVEASQVLSVDYRRFKEGFLDTAIMCMPFVTEILSRSQKLQALVNREFIFDAVAKVSMMLSTDLEMFNKLKRHDTSLILHIQPATLSRVLNRLKRNKIIDIKYGVITVQDAAALEMIYKEL